MRWRFVDRMEAFEPWTFLRGRKSISLEEYCLLEPLGRKGAFPESLVLESCTQLGRWLVMKRSDFATIGLLSEVRELSFAEECGMEQSLEMTVRVQKKVEGFIEAACEATAEGRLICRGVVILVFMGLGELVDPETMRATWQELYVKA
jgi:3-hydroxymyristoyl/3-hydroxydecanoyl-(acyl carrier protein) dehydratase